MLSQSRLAEVLITLWCLALAGSSLAAPPTKAATKARTELVDLCKGCTVRPGTGADTLLLEAPDPLGGSVIETHALLTVERSRTAVAEPSDVGSCSPLVTINGRPARLRHMVVSQDPPPVTPLTVANIRAVEGQRSDSKDAWPATVAYVVDVRSEKMERYALGSFDYYGIRADGRMIYARPRWDAPARSKGVFLCYDTVLREVVGFTYQPQDLYDEHFAPARRVDGSARVRSRHTHDGRRYTIIRRDPPTVATPQHFTLEIAGQPGRKREVYRLEFDEQAYFQEFHPTYVMDGKLFTALSASDYDLGSYRVLDLRSSRIVEKDGTGAVVPTGPHELYVCHWPGGKDRVAFLIDTRTMRRKRTMRGWPCTYKSGELREHPKPGRFISLDWNTL